jgi:DNA helicase-4
LKKTLQSEELKQFGDFEERVHCGTVHSYKGLEADVVIILNVNKSNFPKIHSDNQLYAIFGVTDASILSDEERLFYVAITRAKQGLYLFTETGRESEYLTRLEIITTDTPLQARMGKSHTQTSGHSIPKYYNK